MPEFPVMPPHEAGAQIRVLATQLYEVLRNPPPASNMSFHATQDVNMAWDKCLSTQTALAVAIEGRKLTEMRPALGHYREAVRVWRNQIYLAATEQISAKTVSYPYTNAGLPVLAAIERLRELANNLPTHPDLPSADSRDTCLRAIIAVLRTHEIPGTEKLTHQAKEDHGKTETAEDTATSANYKPAAVADAIHNAGV